MHFILHVTQKVQYVRKELISSLYYPKDQVLNSPFVLTPFVFHFYSVISDQKTHNFVYFKQR